LTEHGIFLAQKSRYKSYLPLNVTLVPYKHHSEYGTMGETLPVLFMHKSLSLRDIVHASTKCGCGQAKSSPTLNHAIQVPRKLQNRKRENLGQHWDSVNQ